MIGAAGRRSCVASSLALIRPLADKFCTSLFTGCLFALLSACSSPQYRALNSLVEAPLDPLPRYDALGSTAPLTPSVEQWALYEEHGPFGRVLLTAVLRSGVPGSGWRVELTRRSAGHVQRQLVDFSSTKDPFMRMRSRGVQSSVAKDTVVPAGVFVGAWREAEAIYHPRVPIYGLLTGRDQQGNRWRLLRFGLDRPPNAR